MPGLLKPIEDRRARRAIGDRPVPEDVVQRLLTAATYAPSCSNNQPWRLVVVQEPEQLERIKQHLTSGNYWGRPAPLIIAAFTEPDLDCRLSDGRDYAPFGLGLAVSSLLIQATADGLIAHPVAGFKPVPVKQALEIPPRMTLFTLLIIGYPVGDESALSEKHRAQEHEERVRKPREEVMRFDRWGALGE